MKPAQQRLAQDLDVTQFSDLAIPLVNNWQAKQIRTAAEARQGLYEQVPNPVRWIDSIRELVALGATRFIEVGPGQVLTGLLKNIDPTLKGLRFSDPADLEKLNC